MLHEGFNLTQINQERIKVLRVEPRKQLQRMKNKEAKILDSTYQIKIQFFFKYFYPNSLANSIFFFNMQKLQGRILIASFLIIGVLIGVIFSDIFSSQSIGIQKGDIVKIDYQIWESDRYRDYDILNPLFNDIIWITVIPITENSSSGLILGLYNNLLGKEKFYESDLIWLNKCIDQDYNGIDDISGDIALSYGNSTDQYFNTCLMIKFKVLGIEKI